MPMPDYEEEQQHSDYREEAAEVRSAAAPIPAQPAADQDPKAAPPIADDHWHRATEAFLQELRGTAISQATVAWNQLRADLPKLREFLHREMQKGD